MVHTIEEIQELKEWFEGRDLSEPLQVDKATYILNVKETVAALIEQSFICHENPKMQGAVVLLKKIKKCLEEM